MTQRKPWTAQEDDLLRHLKQKLQIKKWSLIAKKMAENYDLPGRSGKQCRERYHNHLDSTIVKSCWSAQEESKLCKLHDDIGNKWAVIAHQLLGRTDNCVKNHFYSKLRKSVRKLNKIIHDHLKKNFKEIKSNTLYKIIEANEERHKSNGRIDEETANFCKELKNKLLRFSDDNQINTYEANPKFTRSLIQDILEFGKIYKKQPKIVMNLSLQCQKVDKAKHRKPKPSKDLINQSDQQWVESLELEISRSGEIQSQQKDLKKHIYKVDPQVVNFQSKGLQMQNQRQTGRLIENSSPDEYITWPILYKNFSSTDQNQELSKQNIFSNPTKEDIISNTNNGTGNSIGLTHYNLNSSNFKDSKTIDQNIYYKNNNVQEMLRGTGIVQKQDAIPIMPLLTKDASKLSRMSNQHNSNLFADDCDFQIKTLPYNPFGNIKQISTTENLIFDA